MVQDNSKPQQSDASSGDAELEREIAQALGDLSVMDVMEQQSPVARSSPLQHAGDHKMVKGTIVAIHDDDVFVELGGKSQGVVALTQFDKPPRLGEVMEFVVESILGDEGLIKLSRQGAVEKATWQTMQRGMIVEGMVTGSNTGGLELKIAGQRAFMPASHIDLGRVENLHQFFNQKLKCQIIELDRRGKKIVVSRRAVLEAERVENSRKLLAELQVGDVRTGAVRSIQPYGAFVDLGGLDGMVHISDLSYERVAKVEDVVKIGQQVQVKILRIEDDGKRISLGIKQVMPDPWLAVEGRYVPGTQATGRVVKLTRFGAFVELEPGVEGLVPMSELSWQRIGNAGQVLKEGEMITAKVLEVKPDRQRITLSLKQLGEDPWANVEIEYPADATVEGTVTRTTDFGAFVRLKDGVEGMVHISEISHKRIGTVDEVLKSGQAVQAKVLSVDPKQRRISLSIKALTAAPDHGHAHGQGEHRGRRGQGEHTDVRKYVVKEDRKHAHSGQTLGSLMEKFGGGGGLKGGLG